MKLISYEKQPVFDYCAVVPVLFCFVFLFQSNEIKTLYVCNNSRLSFPKKVKKKKKKKSRNYISVGIHQYASQ